MASTYTDAGIELIGVGEQSNTWGETTNTNWRLMEEMITGVVSISLNGTSSYNLTTTDGATSNGRHLVVRFTGSPGAAATVTVNPDDMQKVYFVDNSTDEPVTLTQGSGGDVTVPAGTKKIVYCDGEGSSATVTDLTDNLSLSGTLDVSTFKLNGSEVTATASELNTLDGINASTSELNVLDGITASTAELNTLNGFTGDSADLNYAKDLRATGVTASEFDHLDGVTSGVQSQLDSKADDTTTISAGGGLTGGGSLAANRTISHADTSSQTSVDNSSNNDVVKSIAVDTYGHVTSITSGAASPTGMITAFAGGAAPDGWLLCGGQAVSRSSYSDLYSVLGTTYGSGDGATTFNLPDLRDRFPIGNNDQGRSDAGRVSNYSTNLGDTGGADEHQLTEAELPSHNHSTRGTSSGSGTSGAYENRDPVGSTTSGTAGSDQPHNNMPPFLALSFIIKT